MNRRSQAALEFLTTYAWVLIAISVAIGVLYYFGIFDFAKYLPQKCNFPSQFRCLDFSLTPTEVRIKLVNNIGEDLRVTSLLITNEATLPVSCTPPAAFDWSREAERDIIFASCSGGGYIPGERIRLKVTMSYYAINTPSRPVHLINGDIDAQISST